MPSADGRYRVVPGHPSKHGPNIDTVWSRPLRKDHHGNRVTGLQVSGDHCAGVVREVDTIRNFRRVGPRPGVVLVLTVHVPVIVLVSPSVRPEALSNRGRG
jgi:hypothetical protein